MVRSGEEPEARCRQAEQVAIGVGNQLVEAFGRGVELQGMVRTVMFRVWHAGVGAIDAG